VDELQRITMFNPFFLEKLKNLAAFEERIAGGMTAAQYLEGSASATRTRPETALRRGAALPYRAALPGGRHLPRRVRQERLLLLRL
jgi:hypothetical protein